VTEESRNHHGKYFLTLVFASIFLASLGMLTHNAFAMGPYPGTCNNEYYGKFTNATIIVGNHTYYPLKDGVYFQLNNSQSYYLTATIQVSNQSSQGNSLPGSLWMTSDAGGFPQNSCSGTVYPNQNLTIGGNIGFPSDYSPYVNNQITVHWSAYSSSGFSYTVYWIAHVKSTAPQNLQATPGNEQVTLSWTAPSSNGGSAITSYNIYRSTTSGGEGTTPITTVNGSTLTYADTGLTNGQTYFYKVTAVNSVGESPVSNEANATPPAFTVSGAPTGLTANVISSSQIDLSWAAPANTDGSAITGYVIERSTDGGTTWSTIQPNTGSTSTTYSDTSLQSSTTYTYRVSAINSVGTSSPSNTASAMTSCGTVPNPPTDLSAVAVSTSQINLSWTAPSNNGGCSAVTGYTVYRTLSSGTWSSTDIMATGNFTSYNDTGLKSGTMYSYQVTAENSAVNPGESEKSNTATATTLSDTTSTVPNSPTDLSAVAVSSSQINLSWTTPSNNGGSIITGYAVERSTNNGNTWSTIVSNTGSTSTTYDDTGLSPSTTYTYRVSAINSVGTSSPSNTASATTQSVTPPPTGIILNNIQSTSGTASSSNQITLANFNAGTGTNRLLVVGVSANNNDVASVIFGGVSLANKVKSFYNNDAEFWYLKNPTGNGDIIVTMNGPTSAVVGAFSFSGVNQTSPLPTSASKHNTNPNSPNITITTKFANDWVLDLPSIYGGSTLGSPTCTQQWDANVPDAITGASSSKIVPTPGAVTCKWAASSADYWDDAAIEIKASK